MSKKTTQPAQPESKLTQMQAAVAEAQTPEVPTTEILEQFQETIGKATPEQREQLARLGFLLPIGNMADAVAGKFRLGLRCTHCGGIALFFVGDKFAGPDGTEHDEPQQWMRMDQIPWTQNLPVEDIDRRAPRCQECGIKVPLDGDGTQFRIHDRKHSRVVTVDIYQQAHKASFDMRNARKNLERIDSDQRRSTDPAYAAAVADMNLSPDRSKLEPTSKVIERKFGAQALSDVNYLGERAGVTPG